MARLAQALQGGIGTEADALAPVALLKHGDVLRAQAGALGDLAARHPGGQQVALRSQARAGWTLAGRDAYVGVNVGTSVPRTQKTRD